MFNKCSRFCLYVWLCINFIIKLYIPANQCSKFNLQFQARLKRIKTKTKTNTKKNKQNFDHTSGIMALIVSISFERPKKKRKKLIKKRKKEKTKEGNLIKKIKKIKKKQGNNTMRIKGTHKTIICTYEYVSMSVCIKRIQKFKLIDLY